MFASRIQFEAEQLPLIVITAMIVSRQMIKCTISTQEIYYFYFHFCAIRSAKHFYATVLSFPIPPVVENTSGVNTPHLTSLILSPYSSSPTTLRIDFPIIRHDTSPMPVGRTPGFFVVLLTCRPQMLINFVD